MEQDPVWAKLSRRGFVQGTVGLLGLSLLAACGGPGTAAPVGSQAMTIRFGARQGDKTDFIKDRIAAFTKLYPKVTVTYEELPQQDAEYYPKLQSFSVTKNLPDVFWASIGRSSYQFLASKAVLRDVGQRATENKVDLATDFYPNAIESLKVNGKIYALPWTVHPGRSILFYNKTLWEKAGLKASDDDYTFEQLTRDSQKIVEGKLADYGFAGSYGGSDDFLSTLIVIRAFGGEVLSPDGKQCLLNSKEALAAVQWMADMYHARKLSPLPAQGADFTTQNANLFAAGKLAAYQSTYGGQFTPSDAQLAPGVVRANAPMPKGPANKHGSMFEVNCLALSPTTKAVNEAWAFANFMCSKENGIAVTTQTGAPGGRPGNWDDPGLQAKSMQMTVKRSLDGAGPFLGPANFKGEAFNTTMSQLMQQIWLGKVAPAQLLPDVTQKLQAILDQPAQQ